MPVTTVYNLLVGLGPESALNRKNNPSYWWGVQEELMATIAELIDRHEIHYVMANSKDGKGPKPISIPRPYKDGEEKENKPKTSTTIGELKEMVRVDNKVKRKGG